MSGRFDNLVLNLTEQRQCSIGWDQELNLLENFCSSCTDFLHESNVWPATEEVLYSEMTITSNFCVICMALETWNPGIRLAPVDFTKTEKLICHTLQRLLVSCQRSELSSSNVQNEGLTVANVLKKITERLDDPIIRFNVLKLMGRLLVLASLWCLYCKQMEKKTQSLLCCIKKMQRLAHVSVLKEKLTYRGGLILCAPATNASPGGDNPCVEDIVNLVVMSLSPVYVGVQTDPTQWAWLVTLSQCKSLIEQKDYFSAMNQLQKVLKTLLAPEDEAKVLCVFAECYFHLGCPQMAVQTYSDALHTDRRCYNALQELSCIYHSQGRTSLEFEMLNILVKMLSEDQQKNRPELKTDLEEIVQSICPVLPEVTLISAKHQFAKLCFQLERYSDAAHQYSELLKLIQSGSDGSEEEKSWKIDLRQVDVAELVSDTAEALVADGQVEECVALCDEVSQLLLCNDRFAFNNHSLLDDDESKAAEEDFLLSMNESQISLFSCESDKNESQRKSSTQPSQTGLKHYSGKAADSSSDLTQLCRNTVTSWIAKESDTDSELNEAQVREKHDQKREEMAQIFAAKLLVCKADSIATQQQFTDQLVGCLLQAQKILLDMDVPSDSSLPGKDSPTSSPQTKRRRVDSINPPEKKSTAKSFSSICETAAPTIWSQLLVNVNLRLGKAALNREKLSSVINSSQLVLQFDPGNMHALYMKTLVLCQSKHRKQEEACSWLKRRSIDYSGSRSALETLLADKRNEAKQINPSKSSWWLTSESHILSLDVRCIEILLDNDQ